MQPISTLTWRFQFLRGHHAADDAKVALPFASAKCGNDPSGDDLVDLRGTSDHVPAQKVFLREFLHACPQLKDAAPT